MKHKSLALLILTGAFLTTGCAGLRETDDTFTTHAESFVIIGIHIPEDDQAAAYEQVPAGATITNVSSSASDWTSIVGILNNIIGFQSTCVGGTK